MLKRRVAALERRLAERMKRAVRLVFRFRDDERRDENGERVLRFDFGNGGPGHEDKERRGRC